MSFLRQSCLFLFIFASAFVHAQGAPLSLLTDSPAILYLDPPSISPSGKKIAWTVREKPPQAYEDPSLSDDPSKIDFNLQGSKVLIQTSPLSTPMEISVLGKSCWGPSWSPDGETIAYYSDAEGAVELWIYNLQTKASQKVASIPLTPRIQYPIQKVLWSPDHSEAYAFTPSKFSLEKQAASSLSHFTSDPQQPAIDLRGSSDLIAIDLQKGASRTLLAATTTSWPTSFSLSPSGRFVSYTAVQAHKDPSVQVHGNCFDLRVLSTNGKTNLSLAQSLPIDYSKTTHALWHPSSDRLYFLAGEQVWVAQFSEEGLVVCKPVHSFQEKVDPSLLAFTKEGQSLVVGLEATNDAIALALISLNEKKDPIIFNVPKEWTFKRVITSEAGICWQPHSNTLALCAHKTGKRRLQSVLQLDLETGTITPLWEGQGFVQPIGFDDDHQTLYALYEDFHTPEDIFRYDARFHRLQPVSQMGAPFKQVNPGSFEVFETTIRDASGEEEKVETAILLPPGAKRGDLLPAIVVHYPGANLASEVNAFGGGDALGGFPDWLLTNHGFAVILPNLVLGKEAIGKPLQVITSRLLAQVEQAAALGYIDLDRVGLLGQSYGAYGTVGIISHTPLFRAAVAINGTYDLASFSHHLDSHGKNYWMTWAELSQGRMGQPLFDDIHRYINNSPFYRADHIFTPLLLIHGRLDDAIQDAEKMFSALRHLDRPVELVIYHKGWHTFNSMQREDHLDAAQRILDFFHHHLD